MSRRARHARCRCGHNYGDHHGPFSGCKIATFDAIGSRSHLCGCRGYAAVVTDQMVEEAIAELWKMAGVDA
jgi:hypothetical protein